MDVGLCVIVLLKRCAVVRQLKNNLLPIILNGKAEEFSVVFVVGMDNEVGTDLVYRQNDLV
jgi:hypothetical protein